MEKHILQRTLQSGRNPFRLTICAMLFAGVVVANNQSMIGLDTNVLVRYIAQDDAKQSLVAAKLIEQQCSPDKPGFISLVTLVELVWVSESCYDADRQSKRPQRLE